MAARREEDLGGGRASWLVPFDVISPYTYKPTATRKREKKHEGRRNVTPPLKSPPPPESYDRRKRRKRLTKW
nr:MAG: hypothetical protein [Bacteriophage sp.]